MKERLAVRFVGGATVLFSQSVPYSFEVDDGDDDAATIRRQKMREAYAGLAGAASVLTIVGVCAYRRIVHPEWTGGQALSNLWPVYVSAASACVFCWVFAQPPSVESE